MTGLYENIHELQNESTLTFLYRAPKVAIRPLNSILVAKEYQRVFDISQDKANEMASLVKGYPYAYQVLGYLCYKRNCSYNEVIDEFDAYLGEYVYDKIWSELSENDRRVLKAIAGSSSGKNEAIRALADMNSSTFSVYRDRLIKKGLIVSDRYGFVALTLPRFKEYALRQNQ